MALIEVLRGAERAPTAHNGIEHDAIRWVVRVEDRGHRSDRLLIGVQGGFVTLPIEDIGDRQVEFSRFALRKQKGRFVATLLTAE